MRVVSPSMAGFGILPPLRGSPRAHDPPSHTRTHAKTMTGSPRAHDPPLKDFAGRGESAGTAGERLRSVMHGARRRVHAAAWRSFAVSP